MTRLVKPCLCAFLGVLAGSGCSFNPSHGVEGREPEKLVIHRDGSMEFRNRPIPERDVVIYEDGFGGERAAVRVHMQPLHPDFFRDTIVVERISEEEE